jgi:hypothetical protein
MTDQITEQVNVVEPKPDTYHNQGKLVRYADIANGLSWLFFVLFVVMAGIIAYLVYYFVKNKIALEQFFLSLPTFLVPFFIGGFTWIVLKLISEGVYLIMDIEDNTRRPQSQTKE